MRKILLSLIVVVSSIGISWGQSIEIKEGLFIHNMSKNGEWAYDLNQDAGSITVWNTKDNTVVLFDFAGQAPYCDEVSDDGLFVGSFKDKAAIMDKDGNWETLPLPAGQITTNGAARGINADGSFICGFVDAGGKARFPIVWERQSNGKYTAEALPYPKKDFSNLDPQATDALKVSADGSIVAGRFIDYSGMYSLVIIWKRNTNGEWEYKLVGEDLLFNKDVELPFFDPDDRPTPPNPTDYFTEADWDRYNAAVAKYEEDKEGPNPEYNKKDYITDRLGEYNEAIDEFNRLAAIFNKAQDEYYRILNEEFVKGVSLDVFLMHLSPNGRYVSLTLAKPGEDFFKDDSSPMLFDLEAGTEKIFDFENDGLAMGVSDEGSVYYATPYMSRSRSSYIIPAGVEDHSIDATEWILEKTNNKINLADYFTYIWSEYDWGTGEDVTKEGVISGSAFLSSDENVLLGVFQTPDTFDWISYVVDLKAVESVKDPSVDSGINVFPNPVEDNLNISGDFVRLSLINMNGATVLESEENTINVSHLPAGIYILKIELENNSQVVKKILKK